MSLTILDCTLRDGGYYNNWDFDTGLVSRYLRSIAKTGTQVVELGFRSFPRAGFHGPFAYSSDDFLNELELPESLRVAVMVDARTILSSGLGVDAAVARLFSESRHSRVDLVRLAVHFSQVAESEPVLQALKNLGYSTALNMMQAGGQPGSDIENAARIVSQWGTVDVLYFADSMGNMDAAQIVDVTEALKTHWPGDIGFHSHNNMGKAIANCIKAIETGVSWIDATVTGMGRGAGNAQTEILLGELAGAGFDGFRAEPLYEIALADFSPLQKQMGWGTNFAYHYSAIHHVHPTYVQELLSDARYSATDIVNALQFLAQSDSSSFSTELVERAFGEDDGHEIDGGWNAEGWCAGEDILILGAGPGLKKYAAAIESFVSRRGIKALSLNFHGEVSEQIIFGYAAADTRRLTLDAKRYHLVGKPLFTPKRFVSEDVAAALEPLDVRDYDLKVTPGKFSALATGCEIPNRLTVAYAIGLCAIGGANRIFLVGFDGYPANDYRQAEMVQTLEVIKDVLKDDMLISLTPTTYPLTQGSVFAPY